MVVETGTNGCASPVASKNVTVGVAPVVLSFTAPSTAMTSLGTFSVTNQTTLPPGVSPCAGYEYSICETGSPGGSCVATTWQSLPPAGSIPVPSSATHPAYFWLRIRYGYVWAGGNCSSPSSVAWLPAVLTNALDAWPFKASSGPSIWLRYTDGSDVCPVGQVCGPFQVDHGVTVRAYAYLDGQPDPAPPAISWSFGDGGTGSGQGAQHQYLNYTSSTIGQTLTLSGYPTVVATQVAVTSGTTTPPAITNFYCSPSAPSQGTVVTFVCEATSTPGYSISNWRFDFGDQQSTTTPQNSTVHAYAARGTYRARCTVTGSNEASTFREVDVFVACGDADFTVRDQTSGAAIPYDPLLGYQVKAGQALRFDSSSPGALYWFFGDGGMASSSPASHTYNHIGSSTLPMTIQFQSGSCAVNRLVTISPVPPTIGSLVATPAAASVGQNVTFQCNASPGAGGAILTYGWRFGDGQTATSSQGLISYAYGTAGLYVATCTASDISGQSTSREVVVTVGTVQAAGAKFFTVTPCRVVDTRLTAGPLAGPALVAGGERVIGIGGLACSIPASAIAIATNVTVAGGSQPGYLTLWPATLARPMASSINFRAGQTRANNQLIRLSSDGTGAIAVFNGSVGAIHMILDVVGYFRP
jgi:PKD repeat protein